MRLINADKLKEYVKQQEDYDSACTICAYIDEAPTVHFIDVFNNNSYLNHYNRYSEPEPNKYISRIDTECIMLECPECKSRIISTAFSFAVGTEGYSFCPYCGADMRKE